mmetsp:Transcript_37090/g.82500  ORF Transcript_37090/g.82500 Transcript_37090/m.82500 type:complete len:184 (-) Transcript_37090:840-1391(-)
MIPEAKVDGSFTPDYLKFKKTLKLKFLPLELGGTLAIDLHTGRFSHKVNCKDKLLGGKLYANIADRSIEYKKKFSLPLVGTRFGCFVVGGQLSYDEENQRLKPKYHIGFELRRGAELIHMNSLQFKPQLFYGRIGVQARTQLTLQVPSHLMFQMTGAGEERSADVDAWGVDLNVQELSIIVKL